MIILNYHIVKLDFYRERERVKLGFMNNRNCWQCDSFISGSLMSEKEFLEEQERNRNFLARARNEISPYCNLAQALEELVSANNEITTEGIPAGRIRGYMSCGADPGTRRGSSFCIKCNSFLEGDPDS